MGWCSTYPTRLVSRRSGGSRTREEGNRGNVADRQNSWRFLGNAEMTVGVRATKGIEHYDKRAELHWVNEAIAGMNTLVSEAGMYYVWCITEGSVYPEEWED